MRIPRITTAIALVGALGLTGCSTDSEAELSTTASSVITSEVETPTSQSTADAPLDLAAFLTECMRDQGIEDFPEAEVLPDGTLDLDMTALDAAGTGPGSPEFNTAFAACEAELGQTIELGDHTSQ